MPTITRVITYEYDNDDIMRKDMAHWQLPPDGALLDVVGLQFTGKRIKSQIIPHGHEHVLEIKDGSWCLQHPLVCRPALLDCDYNSSAEEIAPDLNDGKYVMLLQDGRLWTRKVAR